MFGRKTRLRSLVPFDAEQPLEFRFPNIGRTWSWLKNEHVWCWECLWHGSSPPTSNLLCFILCHANISEDSQILLFWCLWTIAGVCFCTGYQLLSLRKSTGQIKKRNTPSWGQIFLFNKQPASCWGPIMWPLTPLCPWEFILDLQGGKTCSTSCHPFAFRPHMPHQKHFKKTGS